MDHYHQQPDHNTEAGYIFPGAPNFLYNHTHRNGVNYSENIGRLGADVAVTSMLGLISQQEDVGIHKRQPLVMAPLPTHTYQSDCFLPTTSKPNSAVKSESGSQQVEFHYRSQGQQPSLMARGQQAVQQEGNSEDGNAIKEKIIAHRQYSSLLEAYMDCVKVGAPPEVVARLSAISREFENQQHSSRSCRSSGTDPELDQFMEAYYDMLVKYRVELTRPLQEATEFMRRIESQLNTLSDGSVRVFSSDDKGECVASSEEDQDGSGGETELAEIDPRAEDRQLKHHLLKKYSGYLSSLKQELSKKKKKGKLPKDARQKLLNWWELHYKWPYPSETEKVALAESTGLDQKQINNWFINQRKRHWKPSEDMQFVVMDGHHSQSAALYIEGHLMGDSSYRLCP